MIRLDTNHVTPTTVPWASCEAYSSSLVNQRQKNAKNANINVATKPRPAAQIAIQTKIDTSVLPGR